MGEIDRTRITVERHRGKRVRNMGRATTLGVRTQQCILPEGQEGMVVCNPQTRAQRAHIDGGEGDNGKNKKGTKGVM